MRSETTLLSEKTMFLKRKNLAYTLIVFAMTAVTSLSLFTSARAGDFSWEMFLAAITGQQDTTPTITILSPNGGETIQRGTTATITWNSSYLSENVTIQIFKMSSPATAVYTFQNIVDNGSYNWALLTSDVTGNDFKVRISSSANPNDTYDVSDANFTISPPTLPASAIWYNNRIWQRSDDSDTYTRDDAQTYCNNLTLGNYTGWQLPSKEELKSLVVCTNGTSTPLVDKGAGHPYHCGDGNSKPYDKPTIDSSFSCKTSSYWTADNAGGSYSWSVSFYSGDAVYSQDSTTYYVRCIHP